MADENIPENNLNEEIKEDEEKLNNIDEPTQSEALEADDLQVLAGEEFTLEEKVEQLQRELEETRTKADDYLDGWQRARAEFANYKKRIEREQAQIYQTTAGNLIKRYLEIADDLERALKSRPPEGEGASWSNGIELIYRKLMKTIESEGVTRFVPEGQIFDPNFHEAISHEDSPRHESGEIIEVVQPGYMLEDRILRPARVRVAR